ncbi:MAG: hypothetical protein OEY63_02050 [Gemmatimonadota bacterium]|nr:hypothetical protein [Gemmatimonadota bacterium]MDH5805910.1 hypothetical protein [Gemmatimonadota bacterium]
MRKILPVLFLSAFAACSEDAEQSVQALVDALEGKDSLRIATYLDVDRAAESITDPLLDLAQYVGENEPQAFGGQVNPMELQMLRAMRPVIPQMISQVFWQIALTDEGGENPLTAVLRGRGVDISDATWSYIGAEYVEAIDDSLSVVGATVSLSGLGENLVLPLLVVDRDGHWQVVGIRDIEGLVSHLDGMN